MSAMHFVALSLSIAVITETYVKLKSSSLCGCSDWVGVAEIIRFQFVANSNKSNSLMIQNSSAWVDIKLLWLQHWIVILEHIALSL